LEGDAEPFCVTSVSFERYGADKDADRKAVARAVTWLGMTTFAVARKLGVPFTTAMMWVKAY
jgi:hypothetical protein